MPLAVPGACQWVAMRPLHPGNSIDPLPLPSAAVAPVLDLNTQPNAPAEGYSTTHTQPPPQQTGYVGGPTMAVIAANCPNIRVCVVDISVPQIQVRFGGVGFGGVYDLCGWLAGWTDGRQAGKSCAAAAAHASAEHTDRSVGRSTLSDGRCT